MEAFKLPFAAVWVEPLWFTAQILLILLAGYLTQRFVAKGLTRLGERYPFPPQLLMPLRGVLRWLIMGSALLFVLERLGVSATVLWTALSGFVAVAAVAFFAMWSVLSNLLCAILIFTVGPFHHRQAWRQRPGDRDQSALHHAGRGRRTRHRQRHGAGAEQPVLPAFGAALARDGCVAVERVREVAFSARSKDRTIAARAFGRSFAFKPKAH
jgi:hypothetical protein